MTKDLDRPKRNLPTIATELRSEVEAAELAWQDAVSHAIRAGELLTEAKSRVKHGEWLPWLEANFPGSPRSAQGYMRLAENAEDARRVSHLGIKGALRELASPAPPRVSEPPDTDDHLAWARFHLAEVERLSREQAQRCLALADRADDSLPAIAGAARRYGYLLLADPDGSELPGAQADAFESLKLACAEAEAKDGD